MKRLLCFFMICSFILLPSSGCQKGENYITTESIHYVEHDINSAPDTAEIIDSKPDTHLTDGDVASDEQTGLDISTIDTSSIDLTLPNEHYQISFDENKIISSLPSIIKLPSGEKKEIAVLGINRVASVNPVPAPKWWLVAEITNGTQNIQVQIPTTIVEGEGGEFGAALSANEGDVIIITFILKNGEDDTIFHASPLVFTVGAREIDSPKNPAPPENITPLTPIYKVSLPDGEGNSTITGIGNAVGSEVVVLVMNQSNGLSNTTISEKDGSFVITIPGKSGDSVLLVTYEAGNPENTSEFMPLQIP